MGMLNWICGSNSLHRTVLKSCGVMISGWKFSNAIICEEDSMNRAERVYQYMREFGSITPLDAIRDLGYTRLACAISEMKRDGTFNDTAFDREYESKWAGSVENAFFRADVFDRNRILL
jgi:hypothetical protein